MERGLCGIFIGTCVGAAPVTSPGSASPRASPPCGCCQPQGSVPRAVSPGRCPQHEQTLQHVVGAVGNRGWLCSAAPGGAWGRAAPSAPGHSLGPSFRQPVPDLAVPKGCPQTWWQLLLQCAEPQPWVPSKLSPSSLGTGRAWLGSPMGWPLGSPNLAVHRRA